MWRTRLIFFMYELGAKLKYPSPPFASFIQQKNALYDGTRMQAFVCDPTHEALPSIIHRVPRGYIFGERNICILYLFRYATDIISGTGGAQTKNTL